MLNWERLLHDHEIPYVTSGPNTRRGELSIKCPYCGGSDPSEHLGISSQGWGCLRDTDHRGTSNLRLLRALLGVSYHQASLIAKTYSTVDPDSLGELGGCKKPLSSRGFEGTGPFSPSSPDEFEPIRQYGTTGRFWRYLAGRGFDNVGRLCVDYGLQCAQTGRYKDRIIIPVYDNKLSLIGWTGRAIGDPKLAPRYLTSSEAIGRAIFNMQRLPGGPLLVVTEGPFDALKLDFYGIHATATFGVAFRIEQAAFIAELSLRYDKTVILYDTGALAQAWALAEWVPKAIIGSLPDGVKDPGDLSGDEVRAFKAAYP